MTRTDRPPSPRALSDWYAAQPKGERTCSDCGTVGPSHYVQPQHPFYAEGREGVFRCAKCIAAINTRMREERKTQLAAEPRCEIPGCKVRSTYTVAGVVGMCGLHLKRAQRVHQMNGSALALFMPVAYSREALIRMATKGEAA